MRKLLYVSIMIDTITQLTYANTLFNLYHEGEKDNYTVYHTSVHPWCTPALTLAVYILSIMIDSIL